MASVKVYQHPRCSTCKKAISFLEKKRVRYDVVDITEKPPTKTELKKMLAIRGEIKKLFNTSGEHYRKLRLKDKLPKMSETEALTLLAGNGMLVKRPFVLKGSKGLVGFREDEWKAVFS